MNNQMQTQESVANAPLQQQGAGKVSDKPQVGAGPVVPPKKRRTVQEVVADWAADLTPLNAPDQAVMGPLAWVRNCKVQELVAALSKEGIK